MQIHEQHDPVALVAEALPLARAVAGDLRGVLAESLYGRPGRLDLIAERIERGGLLSPFVRSSLRTLLDEIDARIAAGAQMHVEAIDHYGLAGEKWTAFEEDVVLSKDAARLESDASPLRRLVQLLERLDDLRRSHKLLSDAGW